MPNPIPMPVADPITGPPDPNKKNSVGWLVSNSWIIWLQSQSTGISNAPTKITDVPISAASASIVPTSLNLGATSQGVYRVTYYARISRAASASSSLTVSIQWTDGGVAITGSGAAITGNTTTTFQSNTLLLQSDANSPITYSTTYSSTGATTMQYTLRVIVEQMP